MSSRRQPDVTLLKLSRAVARRLVDPRMRVRVRACYKPICGSGPKGRWSFAGGERCGGSGRCEAAG